MEPQVTNCERRGRKRRRKIEKNAPDVEEPGPQPKKRAIEIRGIALVGRYVLKEFDENGVFLGKISSYDSGLYRAEYEDGDCEDLDSGEVRQFLIAEDQFDDKLSARRKKLEKFLEKNRVKLDLSKKAEMPKPNTLPDRTETDSNAVDEDDDSYSNSSDDLDLQPENQSPTIPPPELPPSSGTIGLPEDCVPYLFSVYGFLRSFSVNLFLSPFTLDDLVGSLNCPVPNMLLDAIHVSLLRKVRQHLETLSSDGSDLALKCLRCIDWTLLDLLTWPVYIVQYFRIMKYTKEPEWKGFYSDVLDKDYCSLSARRKLKVLQILCDDALENAGLRAEIDAREESEVGLTYDIDSEFPLENGPMRVQNRSRSSSSSKHKEETIDSSNTAEDEDKNSDECRLCGMDGTLLCCDGCPSAYHSRCIGVSKMFIPDGPWFCPECTVSKTGPTVTIGTSLKGAEVFGSDPYGQVFTGTCNHLVVINVSLDTEPFARYYDPTDIPTVLRALNSCTDHEVLYSEICKSILKYWEISQDVLPQQKVQPSTELIPKKEETASEYRGEEGTVENKLTSNSENHLSENSVKQTELAKDNCPNAVSDNVIGGGNKNGISLRIKFSLKKDQTKAQMGSSFKPQAYMNNYIHGEFAAYAAAAYVAVFSSENNRTEFRALDNPKKVMAANVSLQTKAFSSVAVRFFWPSTEKKLFEVPRERCGWCLSCQGSVTSKKACLLNAAALNATRFATKIISGLRLSKNVENSLYSIAMYTLYLEESLRGLLLGPFESAIYRSKWRRQVELSSSCAEIKARLIELEGNLRTISLSGDWTKLVDDWDVKPLNIQNTPVSSVPKRGPGRPSSTAQTPAGTTQSRGRGRPPKKHIFIPEVLPDESAEKSNDYIWWRGRTESKLVTQKGILPHAMLKKAARLGAKTKIAGLHYADISDIPKQSRQLVWRAAVERSKNASHLALQVRHLDHHIRWNDLVRPEQTPQDMKGQESEGSAFRNAFIVDKRVTENKVMFGIVFGHQKHLPSRVMKSIIEKEETQDGKEKYWFFETKIPLYLIREYEQQLQTENAVLPIDNLESRSLSTLQKKQLKDSKKNIFLYLVRKRDNMGVCCFCASCQQNVLVTNSVACGACEGYCHRECTVSSMLQGNEGIGYVITCKSCVHAKTIAQHKNVESPTSPLSLQGQEYQNGVSAAKNNGIISDISAAKKGKKKQSGKKKPPIGTPDSVADAKKRKKIHKSSSGMKGSNLNSEIKKKLCSLGLIWKKNKKNEPEDNGVEFRRNHLLMKGNPQNMDVSEVQCRSCQKQYDPSFMYIHCECCKFWYHSMTVELDESKLSELLGFKCCKCRRIRQPACPLREGEAMETVSCSMSEQADSSIPNTPLEEEDDVYIELDDPLLSSVEVNPDLAPELNLDWDNTTTSTGGAQKLQLRRQNDNNSPEPPPPLTGPQKLPVRRQNNSEPPQAEWGVDFDQLNFDSAVPEFEPQTYFSFTELLEADDSSQAAGTNQTENNVGVTWESFGGEASQSGLMEDFEPGFNIQCQSCMHSEPPPELFCHNCGMYIHSHCSPWEEEEVTQEETWKCGNCRAWR